jgi:hypothetical protein
MAQSMAWLSLLGIAEVKNRKGGFGYLLILLFGEIPAPCAGQGNMGRLRISIADGAVNARAILAVQSDAGKIMPRHSPKPILLNPSRSQ